MLYNLLSTKFRAFTSFWSVDGFYGVNNFKIRKLLKSDINYRVCDLLYILSILYPSINFPNSIVIRLRYYLNTLSYDLI